MGIFSIPMAGPSRSAKTLLRERTRSSEPFSTNYDVVLDLDLWPFSHSSTSWPPTGATARKEPTSRQGRRVARASTLRQHHLNLVQRPVCDHPGQPHQLESWDVLPPGDGQPRLFEQNCAIKPMELTALEAGYLSGV